MADFKKLRKKMEKELHAKRYEHTLSVAYTAASLAMVHNVDTDSAMTAGLLHDCAKCLPTDKLISLCRKNDLDRFSFFDKSAYHGRRNLDMACLKQRNFGSEPMC